MVTNGVGFVDQNLKKITSIDGMFSDALVYNFSKDGLSADYFGLLSFNFC